MAKPILVTEQAIRRASKNNVMAADVLQPCLLGVGYRVSSVTTSSWKREFILRSATVLGKATLLPASGSSRQPDSSTFSPDSEVPASVIAAAGVILQDTLRLLQVGPSVQAVPTAPTEELSCCNRLQEGIAVLEACYPGRASAHNTAPRKSERMRRWQMTCGATY